jgi:hypothetical protein
LPFMSSRVKSGVFDWRLGVEVRISYINGDSATLTMAPRVFIIRSLHVFDCTRQPVTMEHR